MSLPASYPVPAALPPDDPALPDRLRAAIPVLLAGGPVWRRRAAARARAALAALGFPDLLSAGETARCRARYLPAALFLYRALAAARTAREHAAAVALLSLVPGGDAWIDTYLGEATGTPPPGDAAGYAEAVMRLSGVARG